MKQLWELYLEWRIRRLARKLMLAAYPDGSNSALYAATYLYRSPLPSLKAPGTMRK